MSTNEQLSKQLEECLKRDEETKKKSLNLIDIKNKIIQDLTAENMNLEGENEQARQMLIEIIAERDALRNEVSRLEARLYEEKKVGGGKSSTRTRRRRRKKRTGKSARKNRVKSRK